MNSNLEKASRAELALTDWLRVAGLLIFVAFVCFSIVLFGQGANHASANQTQAVVQAATPTAGSEPRPESTPEAGAQSATAVAVPEAHSESAPPSGVPLSPPTQQPLNRMATEKAETPDNAIRKHRTHSGTRRQANRGRSAVDKVVLKSFNTLVDVWRRIFKARK